MITLFSDEGEPECELMLSLVVVTLLYSYGRTGAEGSTALSSRYYKNTIERKSKFISVRCAYS